MGLFYRLFLLLYLIFLPLALVLNHAFLRE